MNRNLAITFGVVVVLLLAVLVYRSYSPNKPAEQTFCAQDVQQCPDGSYVSRIPPTCEFAMCPVATSTATTTDSASTTKTFYDAKQKVGFDYLDNFYYNGDLTNYIHPVEWPPQITVSTSLFTCKQTGKTIGPDGQTVSKNINGSNYCITTQSEGAAGSTYTTYTYKLPVQKKVVTITFVARTPQCMNYDEPKQSECKDEETNFSYDQMVDKIFQSVKFQ